MTFESSIEQLNYFQIVILIYSDIVLITQAHIKALGGADDVELNTVRESSGGLQGPVRIRMIFPANELAACSSMNLRLCWGRGE